MHEDRKKNDFHGTGRKLALSSAPPGSNHPQPTSQRLANVCLQPRLRVVCTQYQAQFLLSRYVLSRRSTCSLLATETTGQHAIGGESQPRRTGGTPFSPVGLIGSQQTRSTSNSLHTAWIYILDDLSPSYLHRQPILTDTRAMRSVHLQAENRTPDFYDFGGVQQSLRAVASRLCHEDFPL